MILPRKTILDAQGYDTSLYLEDWLMKLDFNENILGPSPKVIEALKNIDEKHIKFYPVYGELISKLAEFNNIDKNMIIPTNGADEAISCILNTFVEAEDVVLTITPTFSMPKVYAKNIGCNYKEISYKEKWVFPLNDFINNINDNVKMVIITTPNSPTGEAISRDDLLKIIDKAKNSIILIDETYSSYANEKFTDLVEKYSNVIITRSLSKDFALAGLRIGYIISNTQNINYIKRVISPFSVNTMAVKAAIASLDDKEYHEFIKKQIKESKEILIEGLKPFAKTVYKSETNFLFIDFGEKAGFIYKRLLNAGIKVKNFFGSPDIGSCFRMSIPSPAQAEIILNTIEQKRDLIIFDVDGVLVDTRKSYRTAIQKTYEHFAGKSISHEDIQAAKNQGGLNNDWDCTKYLIENSGIKVSYEKVVEKFQQLYYGNNGNGFILNEEILIEPEILRLLAKTHDLAIFTGRPRLEAEFVLKRWNLKDVFSVIITMDDIPEGFHKPDPYGIKLILEIINANEIYYLGDTPDDIIAAKKAGVKGIGVLPPQDKSKNLKNILLSQGAAQVIENTKDILNIINQVTTGV